LEFDLTLRIAIHIFPSPSLSLLQFRLLRRIYIYIYTTKSGTTIEFSPMKIDAQFTVGHCAQTSISSNCDELRRIFTSPPHICIQGGFPIQSFCLRQCNAMLVMLQIVQVCLPLNARIQFPNVYLINVKKKKEKNVIIALILF